jgi:hypothetical protein
MKAAQELEKLNQAERDLAARREQLTAALKEATATRAGEILDSAIAGKEPGVPDSRVASLQADLAAVSEALELLIQKRKDTERRAGYERVDALLEEAARVGAEADRHEAKTLKLLADLKAHEGGTDYAPAERIGNPKPRTAQLRTEAGGLKTEADKLKRGLDLEPVLKHEEQAEEARWAAVDSNQVWEAMGSAYDALGEALSGKPGTLTTWEEDDATADDTIH